MANSLPKDVTIRFTNVALPICKVITHMFEMLRQATNDSVYLIHLIETFGASAAFDFDYNFWARHERALGTLV
jgi:hypothetical protein